MRIGIVGSGVVGYATGNGFSQIGHSVLFYDVNAQRIKWIKENGHEATSDVATLANHSDVIFICVPTPTVDGRIDLSYVRSTIISLGPSLSSKKSYFVLVVKSSVVPTTTENSIIPLLERQTGKIAGRDFGVCVNPEFLQERCANEDFMNPDRIVIGQLDIRSGDILESLYDTFICPKIRVDLRTAEIIKYANNCFYATKISFFNEIHLMCSKLGIDSNTVREAVKMDRYYGTHPWFHGRPFGGKCLPKDLSAIIEVFETAQLGEPVLLKSVQQVNEKMTAFEHNDITASAAKGEIKVGVDRNS
jgi:UDPglucose 6-dehydrogenase